MLFCIILLFHVWKATAIVKEQGNWFLVNFSNCFSLTAIFFHNTIINNQLIIIIISIILIITTTIIPHSVIFSLFKKIIVKPA